MAKADPHADEHAAAATPPVAGGSMMGRLLVIVLVMVVVVVECAVAYLCIPAAPTQAGLEAGGSLPKSTAEKKKAEQDPVLPAETDPQKITEVDMGDYSITVFHANSNSTMRFDFKVYGTIKLEDKKEYDELFEKHKQRVREQVNATIRSADNADLVDPNLGLIKRTILERARNILGKPDILHDVLIPDFSFVEN